MRWLAVGMIGFVALLYVGCGSGNEGSRRDAPGCAGDLGDLFREQAAAFPWGIYCPTFLPVGSTVDWERTEYGYDATIGRGLSTIVVNMEDGAIIEIFQGYILIVPRNEQGLPVATPERQVRFGDVPATLYRSVMPLIRSNVVTGEEITRAIRGSEGMDPEVLVRVAKGMRLVRVEP